MNLGQRLTALRSKKHLTQDQIAEILGVKRARYNAWENSISNPDYEYLAALAKFHHVTVDFLLGLPHKENSMLLTADMYADGYTDESVLQELEEELLSKLENGHTTSPITPAEKEELSMIARKVISLKPDKRKLINSLLDSMSEVGEKAQEDDAD